MKLLCTATAICCVLLWTLPIAAQESKAEVFGGYSYLRFNPPSNAGDFFNLRGTNSNGANAAFTWNFNRYVGATADFSFHYGENLPGSSRLYTFLFGPKLTLPVHNASLFVHVLGGEARGSRSGVLGSNSGGAYAFGGGLDWKLRPRVSLRVAQFDYLGTRFVDSTQNNLRFSSGIVFHF